MHMFGGHQRPLQRPVAACKHFHVRAVREIADDPGIPGGERQRHVSGNRSDAEDLDFIRRPERQHDGGRIVLAGIRVDDDLAGISHASDSFSLL
jgi:hypothetical protein